ncbi:MAG: ABC transporter transmembrane domain-containing protein, partial [Rhodococcus sp. (in: high G+C Gram-positive bacteria)]
SSLYISALSNDVNTIETEFIGKLKNTIQVGIAFVGALGMMLWCSPLLTLIGIVTIVINSLMGRLISSPLQIPKSCS